MELSLLKKERKKKLNFPPIAEVSFSSNAQNPSDLQVEEPV